MLHYYDNKNIPTVHKKDSFRLVGLISEGVIQLKAIWKNDKALD